MSFRKYKLAVVGSSAGGLDALFDIFDGIVLPLPVVIVQHLSIESGHGFINTLNEKIKAQVKEAEDKQHFEPEMIYIAPPGYHLLVNQDYSFSLSIEDKVNFSRPSIDVLFESAAMAFGRFVIGVILTGANSDGAYGLKKIRDNGGLAVIQNPENAYCSLMPKAALNTAGADFVAELEEIAGLLSQLSGIQYDE